MRVAEPGEEVHVAARVHNSGHATAHDVVVVLPVPDRTTYVAGSAAIDGREAPIDERGGDPFGFGTRPSRRRRSRAGATLVVEYRARIDSPLDDNTRLVLGGAVASAETAEFELDRAELTVRSASRFDTDATRLVVDAPTKSSPAAASASRSLAENDGTCAADDVRVPADACPTGCATRPARARSTAGRSARRDAPAASCSRASTPGARVEAAIDAYVVSPAVDGTPLPITGSLAGRPARAPSNARSTVRSSPRFLESRNILSLDGPTQVAPGSEVARTSASRTTAPRRRPASRVVTDADPALQSLRYADGGGEARVQPGGIVVGTLAPGATKTIALIGTVASPIADRSEIRLRARLDSDQNAPRRARSARPRRRSRPRFSPATSRRCATPPASRCARAVTAT